MTTYTLAGGCFWCLDAVCQKVQGVSSVVSGYTGGSVANPTYEAVCTGKTGHAEATQVTFDETVVPADVLLDMFFTIHDPTTLNRQGNDVGSQYRSAMFYVDEIQKKEFEAARARAQDIWDAPIVTELVPLGAFYAAEEIHQDYYQNDPMNPYCFTVITPKITKARQKFKNYLTS